ncbi:MAG: putative selenium-dependent hydroxylase accessory protein YqeC [Nitrospinae bacterium]|nr:putative selenium-dependent hydroxylase accessory protein YqeC [Nitrospinota bacterium]
MRESGLIEALEVRAGEMVCLVGGGGKTSLMFWLGRELAERYGRAIMTTTTRILEPNPSQAPCLLVSADEEEIRALIRPLLDEHGRVTLAARRLPEGKLSGFPSEVIERLALALPGVPWVIEADGSRQKPLKAPNATEPVIPPSTSLVVAMVGLDALEGRLTEEYVFRPEVAARLLGVPLGDPVVPEHVVGLLAHPEGILKGTPPGARTIAFLNKVDLPGAREKGEALALSILLRTPPLVKRVLLGSAAATCILPWEG